MDYNSFCTGVSLELEIQLEELGLAPMISGMMVH